MPSRKVKAPPTAQRMRRLMASTAARQAAGWLRRQRRTGARVSAAHTSTPRATTTTRALRRVCSGRMYLQEQGHSASLTIHPILDPKSSVFCLQNLHPSRQSHQACLHPGHPAGIPGNSQFLGTTVLPDPHILPEVLGSQNLSGLWL